MKNYLKYSIFPIMLVTDSKEFSHNFSRPESELDKGHKSVRFKRECILDVTLGLKSGCHCGSRARRSHPSRFTFTFWLIETLNAVAMFRTAGSQVIPETLILNWLTSRNLLVTRMSRICQIMQFTIVDQIPNAAVKVLLRRDVTPAEQSWIKGVCMDSSDLKRRVDVQVFTKGWNLTFDETI